MYYTAMTNNSVISEHLRNLRNTHLELLFSIFLPSSQYPVVLNDGIIQNFGFFGKKTPKKIMKN